jgi:hypothetical protein
MKLLCALLTVVLFLPTATLAGSPAPSAGPGTRPIDMQQSATVSALPGLIITGPEDAPCTFQYEGAMRYSPKHKALMLCDGKQWNIVKTEPVAP